MKVPVLSLRARVLSMLVISAACILACGTQYTISAWSPQLKKQLNCTQVSQTAGWLRGRGRPGLLAWAASCAVECHGVA